jgi:hypothetical protein
MLTEKGHTRRNNTRIVSAELKRASTPREAFRRHTRQLQATAPHLHICALHIFKIAIGSLSTIELLLSLSPVSPLSFPNLLRAHSWCVSLALGLATCMHHNRLVQATGVQPSSRDLNGTCTASYKGYRLQRQQASFKK